MSQKQPIPNPGSKQAIKVGCNCPTMDNANGEGIGALGDEFWITGDCLLHGFKDWSENK